MSVQQLQCVFIMLTKNEIRKQIKKLLQTIIETNQSTTTIQTLLDCKEYIAANLILAYIPFQKEASPIALLQKAYADNKIIGLPKITDIDMHFYHCNKDTEFLKNTYGILEPKNCKKITYTAYKNIICIVPGIAFTKEGKRLGRGKGYYDKFFGKLFSTEGIDKITIVGFCHSIQLLDEIPTEKHDISMDYIITEKELIKCKK